jgi:N-methylhydantoinase A/oxoprolinase/acetone carboxylase beta subunit
VAVDYGGKRSIDFCASSKSFKRKVATVSDTNMMLGLVDPDNLLALPSARSSPPAGERRISLDAFLTAPVYAFDRLAPGQTIGGPAIVESAMTTILLRPGERAVTTPLGWLDIALPDVA